MRAIWPLLGLLFVTNVTGAGAQGKSKGYVVSTDHAIVVTREVLVKQGFEVVRIEETPVTRVIWYRRGNNGKGKGKGRPEKLVIRRLEDRVIFEDAPPALLVDIDVRLKLP